MTNALATAEAIVRVAQDSDKPILCCFMGIVDVSAGVRYLQANGYPVFRFPENAAKAFGALYRYAKWLSRRHLEPFSFEYDVGHASEIIRSAMADGRTQFGELEGNEILRAYGFNVLPTRLAKDPQEAAAIAEDIGLPVVLKIVSPQILHKTDAGGVVVGLDNVESVRQAFEDIVRRAAEFDPQAQIDGVLVQKMAPSGTEVIMGASRYPIFGPLIMFGFGGIFVEVFRDVAFRLAPIGRNEARRMIRKIRGYRLLQGFRDTPRADLEILEQYLMRLSDMVIHHPEIKELDINPVLVHDEGKGATIADCRIILDPIEK